MSEPTDLEAKDRERMEWLQDNIDQLDLNACTSWHFTDKDGRKRSHYELRPFIDERRKP